MRKITSLHHQNSVVVFHDLTHFAGVQKRGRFWNKRGSHFGTPLPALANGVSIAGGPEGGSILEPRFLKKVSKNGSHGRCQNNNRLSDFRPQLWTCVECTNLLLQPFADTRCHTRSFAMSIHLYEKLSVHTTTQQNTADRDCNVNVLMLEICISEVHVNIN